MGQLVLLHVCFNMMIIKSFISLCVYFIIKWISYLFRLMTFVACKQYVQPDLDPTPLTLIVFLEYIFSKEIFWGKMA